MPWYDSDDAENKHADDAWWTDAMNNDAVVTRDQLPSFKQPNFSSFTQISQVNNIEHFRTDFTD